MQELHADEDMTDGSNDTEMVFLNVDLSTSSGGEELEASIHVADSPPSQTPLIPQMLSWIGRGHTDGLRVNYTPGGPAGLWGEPLRG